MVHKSNKSTTLLYCNYFQAKINVGLNEKLNYDRRYSIYGYFLENDIILCYKADMFVWTCHKINLSFQIKLGNRKIKAGTPIKVVIY